MVKLKMFRGRWLITLYHWLMNLPSTTFHVDLATRLCVVNFSIMQLTSEERVCFNASRVELNWSYWILIFLADLWISQTLWLLEFLGLFLNVTLHWVCLADGNITPSLNLPLDWVTMFKVPFTGISSYNLMYRETILSMFFFIHCSVFLWQLGASWFSIMFIADRVSVYSWVKWKLIYDFALVSNSFY